MASSDETTTYKKEPGADLAGTKPVADHESKKVMLRAERRDEIEITQFIHGGSRWPTEYTVVQRTNTYYGPDLLLAGEFNGEDRNFRLSCPGPYSHLILWAYLSDADGFQHTYQPIAEVKAKIAGTEQYRLCDICGEPVRDIWHERYRAFGIDHDAGVFGLGDDLRTDGGHLPSDPTPQEDQWMAIKYEEQHVDIRFAQLYCDDCGAHREHLIELDTNYGTVMTECESCNSVDFAEGEEVRGGDR